MFQAWERLLAIAAAGPDLVHVHYGTFAGALHRFGLPEGSVVTWHGYDANEVPRRRGDAMYRELFAGPYRHTVGSSFMRERLVQLGADPATISLIPMGIDLDRFPCVPRESLGPGATLRLVSVGRLDEMKGHGFLIQAAARLLDDGRDIDLRIIGDGPLAGDLHRQVQATGHADRIKLLGAQPSEQVTQELARAHLFALTGVVASTGRVETQGVVFAEAQATGLPVIACNVGGVSDSLIDGETGVLCPPGDVEAIASAIASFMDDPAKLECFGRRARAFVEERFSVETMLDSFERLYERHLAGAP
jgi:colanic acid/amylovoran biosynthesis glycosyltransferase